MLMRNIKQNGYLVPESEIVEVMLEEGFAQSQNIEDPEVRPEQPW